ncbi:MAG: lipoate--protein ligase family protein [Bacteroidales bacterium]|nr:lipoate--protein ligase family protein [Bacteroidales bacterium]
MEHILLPDRKERPLVFYLAMEEYVAQRFGSGFFTWSVAPTVIFGRNQDMEAEVNLPYCRENGIALVRRKSGGGCVYADRGNLMLSCVTPGTGVEAAFAAYLERFAGVLRAAGFDAVSTAHNDILVRGRKVSGGACLVRSGACIVHGTLLCNVDLERMERAITPSQEKLAAKGIRSVRQRVVNLCSGTDAPTQEQLAVRLAAAFTDGQRLLDAADLRRIAEIEKSYLDPAFLFGKLR